MPIPKRFSALFLAICLTLSMGMPVWAHEVPDDSRTGSVSIAMTYGEKTVPGGMLTLYQVGEIYENDGNYSFVLTGTFQESGVSLTDLESSQAAASLAEYAASHSPKGIEVLIGQDGKVTVPGLTLGLYLVVQTKAADGYEAVMPFLVSVPMNEGGTYIYDVDATPKVGLLKERPLTPTTPTPPQRPAEPNTILPQTGQLNWPVPALAVLGLCLFFFGWMLRFGKEETPYEA